MNRAAILSLIVLLAPLALAGCVEDSSVDKSSDLTDNLPEETTSWGRDLPETIGSLQSLSTVAEVKAAAGIWTEGDFAYVSGLNSGFYVLNLTTPEDPQVVGHLSDVYGRDVDMLHYDDGRMVAAIAASGDGLHLVDVTDPTNPTLTATWTGASSHNLAVVPDTHLIYNSRSISIPDQGLDIVDASDPANPELARFADNVLTCHDVTFHVTEDKKRAYCPGVVATQIWDISDPEQPQVVSEIANPAINIHHWAKATPDGDMLIIGDEHAGAAAYGCGAYAEAGGVAASDTVGAVWFYDISNEEAPVPLGHVSAPAPTDDVGPTMAASACTAHFGDFVPDRDKLVVGWYIAGTLLIDFSDPTNPLIVDQVDEGGDVWDAQVLNGYVFTGDTRTGMSVMTFVSADA